MNKTDEIMRLFEFYNRKLDKKYGEIAEIERRIVKLKEQMKIEWAEIVSRGGESGND